MELEPDGQVNCFSSSEVKSSALITRSKTSPLGPRSGCLAGFLDLSPQFMRKSFGSLGLRD